MKIRSGFSLSCIICCFGLILSSSLQASDLVTNQEISELYSRADQQMVRYTKLIEAMDQRFKNELLGHGYVTKVFNTPILDLYKNFSNQRIGLREALEKHRINATKMGSEDRWIDKMRSWADYNTQAAIRHTWLAKMELTKAEIARLYTLAGRFSEQQSKRLRQEQEGAQAQFGDDYKKIEQKMALIYEEVGSKERKEVDQIWQQYQMIGNEFAEFRKQLTNDTWRWFHYHQDRHFEARARSYKKFLFKSFAYDLDSRPADFVNDYFGGRAFADSDLDFFMNMPGTEDRLTMYIHAAKDLNVFYKLNSFVADKPVEFYDAASDLAPLRVSGSMIERIAKLLAARQKSYYLATEKIEKTLNNMKPIMEEVRALQSGIVSINNLSLDLQRFVAETQSIDTLAASIESAQQDLELAESEASEVLQALRKARRELENQQRNQSDRVLLDYSTQQYRLVKPGETGKSKNELMQSLQRRSQLLEEQLMMTDPESEDYRRIATRKQEIQQTMSQLASIVSESVADTQRKIKQLEDERVNKNKTLAEAKKQLNELLVKQSARSKEAVAKAYQSLHQRYQQLYQDVNAGTLGGFSKPSEKLSSLVKDQLIAPQTESLKADVIAEVETIVSYHRGLQRVRPDMTEWLEALRAQLNSLLAVLKRQDQRQAQYAKAVARHKAQASSVVIYVAQQAGASNTDPVVQFMRALRDAVKVTEKYLTPTEIAAEKLNLSDEEKQILDTGNNILQYFVEDKMEVFKLDKLREKLDVAKQATALVENYAGKGETIGAAVGALRSEDAPNLANSLSYFATIAELGKMAADGAPVFGDLFGSYMDFLAYSVNSIKSQALSIQDRVFENAEKYLLSVKPEQHLYTMSEIESEMPTINFSDRDRVLRIYQIRRVVALMQAKSFKDVCDRSLGNTKRCN
ncbi:MAG: hypothetical protein MI867_13275 [Pseudomonadales bacterium]|nr:hypothetical protein [Pseudomonadales bacterium]